MHQHQGKISREHITQQVQRVHSTVTGIIEQERILKLQTQDLLMKRDINRRAMRKLMQLLNDKFNQYDFSPLFDAWTKYNCNNNINYAFIQIHNFFKENHYEFDKELMEHICTTLEKEFPTLTLRKALDFI